ncbi:MAG: hypothetical protein ACREK3_06725 [Gemmatimonadota bacterium]
MARLLAEGEFTPTSVIVTPELAALHFQGAVEQAQASVRELLHAERLLSDPENAGLAEDEDDAFLFILVASSWDKCLRYSSAAVILSVAAAEAQMNEWLESNEAPKTAKSRQHLPLRRKVALILEGSKGGRLSSIEQQEFDAVIALRNRLVHSIPEAESLPLANAPQPGYWLSVEARRACLIVRKVLTRLARSLQQDPPRYLAYCPLVDPADDDEWNRAVLFTGAREDPDFPPATQLEPPE